MMFLIILSLLRIKLFFGIIENSLVCLHIALRDLTYVTFVILRLNPQEKVKFYSAKYNACVYTIK